VYIGVYYFVMLGNDQQKRSW